MSHEDAGPLAAYNSLCDRNLAGFFSDGKRRKHLKRAGLISRRGEIVTETTYRLNMARKEHKRHVRDLLSQAIVHKTLDMERGRQAQVKKKLEEIAKIELVRRVRADRARKGDEEILPYLSPRGSRMSNSRPSSVPPRRGVRDSQERPGSAPQSRMSRSSRSSFSDEISDDGRPKSRIAYSTRSQEENGYEPRVVYIDANGYPLDEDEVKSKSKKDNKYASTEDIDSKNLYQLDQVALIEYSKSHHDIDQGRGRSPYTISPSPPKSPHSSNSTTPRARKSRSPRQQNKDEQQKINKGSLMLHRQEPAMMYQTRVQSFCQVTLHYIGQKLHLQREQFDPRHEVHVDQQHCGGNTLPVFRELILPGTDFTFISRRHRGYPFSLSIYVNGVMDARISTCCEYKHKPGCKIGGKQGHFKFVSIEGAAPCYRCQVERGVKEDRKEKKTKKKAEESNEQKDDEEEKQENEEANDEDKNYDDDFEEEGDTTEVRGEGDEEDKQQEDYSDDEFEKDDDKTDEKKVKKEDNKYEEDDFEETATEDERKSDREDKKGEDDAESVASEVHSDKPQADEKSKEINESDAEEVEDEDDKPKQIETKKDDDDDVRSVSSESSSSSSSSSSDSESEDEKDDKDTHGKREDKRATTSKKDGDMEDHDNENTLKEEVAEEMERVLNKGSGDASVSAQTQDQSPVTEQWAKEITSFSSQYNSSGWSADQAVGSPKIYPKYGDNQGTWAQQTKDANQYLEMKFAESVYITKIDIYETYHAGAVHKVDVMDPSGNWLTVWSGTPQCIKESRIFSPPINPPSFPSNQIKVYVDCSVSNSWCEIDAVQIHGATESSPPYDSETGGEYDHAGQSANDEDDEPTPVDKDNKNGNKTNNSADDMNKDDEAGAKPSEDDVQNETGQDTETDTDEDYLSTVGMEPRRLHIGSIIPLITDNEDVTLTSLALTPDQVEELADYIKGRNDIKTLMLRNDGIDNAGMSLLADAISQSPSSIRMLNLNCNNIGASGADRAIGILKSKPGIKMLLLHGNPIGNEGIANIVDGIEDIYHNSDDNGAEKQAKKNDFGSKNTIESVASDLVNDVVTEAIRSQSPVITDKDEIVSPRQAPKKKIELKLMRLDLGDTKIDDTAISDIQHLIELPFLKITTLNLSGNRKITQSGWTRLVKTLQSHQSIYTLSLDYNKLGDKGAEIIGNLLAINTKLRCVDLEGNKITDEGARALLEGVKKNQGNLVDITLTPGNNIDENLIDEIRDAVREKSSKRR